MKSKRGIFAALAVLMVLTAQPLVGAASAPAAGFVDTDVSCNVDPVFEFTLPPDATIRFPNTSTLIGQFAVGDLLLRYDEQLSIELVPGTMTARGTGAVLPYTVTFDPPDTVDADNIGDVYDVVVTIDAAVFTATRRPYHDADLLFRVRSSATGEVIWQGTTTVTARKTPIGGGDTGGGDNGGGDNGNGTVPDTGDNTIPNEQVPQASPGTSGDGVSAGDNISGEDIPEAQPMLAFWWWWIPTAALGAVLLALLIWLLLWRNVTVSVYGLDLLGQEELIRTIRMLRRRRDEIIIALTSRQVRGGVSGVVELGNALTKHMRGHELMVKVDGTQVFSTIIPAEADGRFQTGIITWTE